MGLGYPQGMNIKRLGGKIWDICGSLYRNGVDVTSKLDAMNLQTIREIVDPGDAGASITDKALLVVPAGYKFVMVSIDVLSRANPSGVDATNTSVWLLEVGTTAKAAKTFNNTVVFPNAGAAVNIPITAGQSELAAGNVLLLSVTNGATADIGESVLEITGYYEKV